MVLARATVDADVAVLDREVTIGRRDEHHAVEEWLPIARVMRRQAAGSLEDRRQLTVRAKRDMQDDEDRGRQVDRKPAHDLGKRFDATSGCADRDDRTTRHGSPRNYEIRGGPRYHQPDFWTSQSRTNEAADGDSRIATRGRRGVGGWHRRPQHARLDAARGVPRAGRHRPAPGSTSAEPPSRDPEPQVRAARPIG